MKKEGTKKGSRDDERAALTGWEQEGGAAPSTRGRTAERQRQESVEGARVLTSFDATHDSSARGEHRYPDSHQTEAEQKTRRNRDDLKRKLAGDG